MASSDVLAIERLALDDVAGGLALSDAAGWNQSADDWSFFIAAGAAFGVRDETGALIATAAALPYDAATGWISMVLVDAAHRHRGIASQLVDACVASLREGGRIAGARRDAGGCRRVREDRLRRRLRVRALGGRRRSDDRGDRDGERHRGGAVAGRDADRPRPQRLRRRSRAAASIVPGPARDARLARSARRRLRAAPRRSSRRAGRSDRRHRRRRPRSSCSALALDGIAGRVFIDVPVHRTSIADALTRRGFVRQRPFVRMALGDPHAAAARERVFALAGPEFG